MLVPVTASSIPSVTVIPTVAGLLKSITNVAFIMFGKSRSGSYEENRNNDHSKEWEKLRNCFHDQILMENGGFFNHGERLC